MSGFIRQTLESFPTLTASRLDVMAYERGFRDSPAHLRHLIACHRPRPKTGGRIYVCVRCRVNRWAHFGQLEIGRARRPLMAFVMVLSFSRQIFLRFFLDPRTQNFPCDTSPPSKHGRAWRVSGASARRAREQTAQQPSL
jgi:hypothetical protein